MRTSGVVIAAAVAAVLLGGCASEVIPGPAAPSASRESATPTTTSTTQPALTMAQAAKRYLRIVRPYNVALEKLEAALNAGEPMSRLTALAKATRNATETELRGLRAEKWPAKVNAQIQDLADAIVASLRDWRRAAQAETREALIEASGAAVGRGADAAKKIRHILRLDKYDEDDYS